MLDTFAGSGSHGVAAIQSNRKFIGIEINKKYFRIIKRRLKKAIKERNDTSIRPR